MPGPYPSQYDQFRKSVQDWKGYSGLPLKTLGNKYDQYEAMIGDFLEGPGQYASPMYQNWLRRNPEYAFIQQAVLGGAEYGGSAGLSGDAGGEWLKNWTGMSPSGIGNIGNYKERLEQLIGRLQVGSNPAAGKNERDMYNVWGDQKDLFAQALGLVFEGPLGDYMQKKLGSGMSYLNTRGADADWLQYLLNLVPQDALRR